MAIRISPAPVGPDGALRRGGYELPEGELPEGQERPPWGAGFALAMTVVDGGWTVCFICVAVQADRRGQCRPPYWHKPM